MICGACGREVDHVTITIDREGDCPGLCFWCVVKHELADVLSVAMICLAVVLAVFVVLVK